MNIEILRHGEARVVPSLIRRMLFGDRERIAVCTVSARGWVWRWRGTDKLVDGAASKLLDRALAEHRRQALALARADGNVCFLVVEPSKPPG